MLRAARHLASYFTVDGKPGSEAVTEGQLVIFASIIFVPSKRIEIICSTQYGKSLWVALACIVVACLLEEVTCVVAPKAEQAKIIMRYFIEHLGDHPVFFSQLEKNTKLERLRQEESKERIILRKGGGIFVISAQQRNASKSIEAAMGQGAKRVIMDEACLIEDNTEATIFRMIGGKGEDAMYCKIGNPFYTDPPNSHFNSTWYDPRYLKIFIDFERGIKEGRYTSDFIDEAKTKPLFSILYGCEFPDVAQVDERGYRQLLSLNELHYYDKILCIDDKPRLGIDIGGGGDLSTFVVRIGMLAFVASRLQTKDTMANVNEAIRLMRIMNIKPENVSIDDIGIGRGVSDRLIELGYNINSVSVGGSATDSETFANIKAENYWRCMLWVRKGGVLRDDPCWQQLTWIKWKQRSGEKQIIIEPKEELKKRTKKSPDEAEALMLTFYEPVFVGIA